VLVVFLAASSVALIVKPAAAEARGAKVPAKSENTMATATRIDRNFFIVSPLECEMMVK
jgi:hypothetical protein